MTAWRSNVNALRNAKTCPRAVHDIEAQLCMITGNGPILARTDAAPRETSRTTAYGCRS